MIKTYETKLREYQKAQKQFKKRMDLVSNLRLVTVLATIISLFYFYFYVSVLSSWVSVLIGLSIFLILIKVHERVSVKYKYISALCEINKKNSDRLKGKWIEFEDDGSEFIDKEHRYTWDLDIFGKGSLYQFINICVTPQGKNKLYKALSEPSIDKESILTLQEASAEMSGKLKWRQNITALAMLLNSKKSIVQEGFTERLSFYTKPLLKVFVTLMPGITFISIIAAYALEIINTQIAMGFIISQFVITLGGIKKRGRALNQLVSVSEDLSAYKDIIKSFEQEEFKSKLLVDLKNKIKGRNQEKISDLIAELEKIAARSSNRNNLFFIPINVLLLWDYHNIILLEKWKEKSGDLLEVLVDVVGDIELLSNLGQVTQDNNHWTFPQISDSRINFEARKIAHPLIIPDGVSNDVSINSKSPMLLITGSNMSGKSTLLRTVGINLILSYIGAPVCAKSLKVSLFEVHTCMRISDNLEKGISSFYGELLRIKGILDSRVSDKIVKLVLLDEIFKGTNSYDRHIGAKALVKQLIKSGASGLVSTHDLELEVLEAESKAMVKNYHFKEHYINNEIKFDYKLREGVSKTRNALHLLKLVGIDIE